MHPNVQLDRVLADLADRDHGLFTASDLQAVLPVKHDLPVLLSRAAKSGLLTRVCRGLYLYPRVDYPRGLILFHAAARLRANMFNYLSLETVLSDAGVISQVPMNWITVMSSGRSSVIPCGAFGRIEFVHTSRRPDAVAKQLTYDAECRLWRASPALALRDMRATHRSVDLVDKEVMDELV
jgi:hypothetical protein